MINLIYTLLVLLFNFLIVTYTVRERNVRRVVFVLAFVLIVSAFLFNHLNFKNIVSIEELLKSKYIILMPSLGLLITALFMFLSDEILKKRKAEIANDKPFFAAAFEGFKNIIVNYIFPLMITITQLVLIWNPNMFLQLAN